MRTGIPGEEIPPPNINLSGLYDNILFSYHAETIQTDLSNGGPQYRREPATDNATRRLFHAGKYQAKGCHQLRGLRSISAATNPPATLVAPKVAC